VGGGDGSAGEFRYAGLMLAANIWYWWIGVVLTGVGVLMVVGLIVGYLKSVTAAKYPNGRSGAED